VLVKDQREAMGLGNEGGHDSRIKMRRQGAAVAHGDQECCIAILGFQVVIFREWVERFVS
jgi:hypothetical protein